MYWSLLWIFNMKPVGAVRNPKAAISQFSKQSIKFLCEEKKKIRKLKCVRPFNLVIFSLCVCVCVSEICQKRQRPFWDYEHQVNCLGENLFKWFSFWRQPNEYAKYNNKCRPFDVNPSRILCWWNQRNNFTLFSFSRRHLFGSFFSNVRDRRWLRA